MSTKKDTKNIIYEMLTENTGTNILDSGGAYGRDWERNQKKTIQDFENEPEERYEIDFEGCIYRTVSVFHFLEQLELDSICEKFNRINTNSDNWDSNIYGVSKEGFELLKEEFGEDHINNLESFNTYNGDSDLSQILQGYWLKDGEYLLLQIHGGCDARGGYTDARLFTPNEEYRIHEFLQEYEDNDYSIEEILTYNKDAYDYTTGEKLSRREIKNRLNTSNKSK